MMGRWIFIVFIFSLNVGFAQTPAKKLVQFSGVIINQDSNTVVPYVTLTNQSTHAQVYAANYKGYFSFVVHEGDTLTFSAIGYKREVAVIPSSVADHRYTIVMKMKQDIIDLPMVRVFPWASEDDFKRQFLSMKFADDDLEIAKKNVSRDNLASLSASLPRDGREMQGYSFQNNHNALANKNINQRLANPLLNPFAWGALMQQIFQGDKSRDAKN